MTAIANLWANIRIFISNYTYYYAALTNVVLLVLVAAAAVLGVVRTSKLPQTPKKRSDIKYLEPSGEGVRRVSQSLSKAIEFKTLTGDRQENERLVGFLKERYKNVFAKASVRVMPSGSLVLQMKAEGGAMGKKPVLFCSHMDVPNASKGWKHDAFSGFDDGSAVWGRGALNGKASTIAMLEALDDLIKEGYAPKRDVYMVFSSDKETGGEVGSLKIAQMFAKRDIGFEFVLTDGGRVSSAHMGSKMFPAAVIGVGEKGSLNIRLTIKAKGSHASAPGKKTAAGILSEAICRIENAPMRKRLLPVVERYLKLSSPAFGYFQRFCLANNVIMRPFMYAFFKNDRAVLPLLRTTFAVTQLNGSPSADVILGEASAVISVGLLQGDTAEKTLMHIKAVLADLPVEAEIVKEIPPSKISDTNTDSYELLCKTVEKHFGSLAVLPSLCNQCGDSVYFEDMAENIYRFSPIMMSPKQQESIYGQDEYIRKDALGVAFEFYKSLLSAM